MSAHVRLRHKLKNQSALTRMLPGEGRNGEDGDRVETTEPLEMAASWPDI